MLIEKPTEKKLHLSIPGLSAASHLNQSVGIRWVWTLMFITCAAICTIQLVDRIKYFFTYPVGLTYEMAGDGFNSFPKITFCRHLPTQAETIFGENYSEHLNQFLDTWENESQPFHSMFQVCRSGSGLSNCTDIVWKKQIASVGEAYTLDINTLFRNVSNWYVLFSSYIDIKKNWKLLLHDDDDDVVYGCLTSAYRLTKYNLNLFLYSKKKFVHVNVPPRPCLTEQDYMQCISNCMDKMLLSNSKCRLPFMKSLLDVPLCETLDEVRNVLLNLRMITSAEKYLKMCNCNRLCVQIEFVVDVDSRELAINETRVVIFSVRDEVEFLQEKRSYVHYALICEISGIIGLYLGACLLTFFEALQVASVQAYKQLTKVGGRPLLRISYTSNENIKNFY